jgi:hypothetical protein
MLTESAASQDQPIRPRLLDKLRDAIRRASEFFCEGVARDT